MNQFLKNSMKRDTVTYNNAVSNSTSGNSVLDYFAECGSYVGREEGEVASSMGAIFGADEELALKTVFYNRMITRKPIGVDGVDSVQRGQGNRDEFAKSLAWLEANRPQLLYKNLWLVPVVGRWSDLWYDSPSTGYNHYVKSSEVFSLIAHGMRDENQRGLIAKYLPKIRSKKKVTTDRHRRLNAFARNFCQYMDWTEKDYRLFKSDPQNTAHLFQRKMCDNDWKGIDFNVIPGKALFSLIAKKGKDGRNALQRHGLEQSYVKWLESKPVAKFTGYPFELYNAARGYRDLIQTVTYNKQFEQLLKVARDGKGSNLLERGVLCALDTSGSMGWSGFYGSQNTKGVDYTPLDVCCGLGIYFSSLLEGHFKDHVVMFDNRSQMLKLQGSFCDKVDQLGRTMAMGGTNFQSVIDEIVRVRRQDSTIPVEDFPGVLLVVSDMQFNPSGTTQTNYERAMDKLAAVGLPKMTVIWWNVNGYGNDVPSTMDDEGTVLISGKDGAIITSILECEEVVDEETGEVRKATPYEQMVNALNQDVLNMLRV